MFVKRPRNPNRLWRAALACHLIVSGAVTGAQGPTATALCVTRALGIYSRDRNPGPCSRLTPPIVSPMPNGGEGPELGEGSIDHPPRDDVDVLLIRPPAPASLSEVGVCAQRWVSHPPQSPWFLCDTAFIDLVWAPDISFLDIVYLLRLCILCCLFLLLLLLLLLSI